MTKSSTRSGRTGATVSKISWVDRVRAWNSHHKNSAAMSLQKLLATPLQSLMTWLVIGIALALPCGLYLVIDNVQRLNERWEGKPRITVFLSHNIKNDTAINFKNKLDTLPGIAGFEFISAEQAILELQQSADFNNVLALLDENPLPPVYIVTAVDDDSESLSKLAEQLNAFKEVEYVQLDLEWVQKLQHIIAFAQRFTLLLGALLSLGILLTVGNTIRLHIENRREEIVVVKLVGGTDAFVRRPLLYTGFWYGLVGGLIAWLLVLLGTLLLSNPIQNLANLYGSDFAIHGIGFVTTLYLLIISSLLGLAGSWLAVARHLHLIQPK